MGDDHDLAVSHGAYINTGRGLADRQMHERRGLNIKRDEARHNALTGITPLLTISILLTSLLACGEIVASAQERRIENLPSVRREFRAVWIATVENIDWPTNRNLSTAQQKSELIRLLDLAKELKLNAVVLQVRPQCDALYRSTLEPWSEYLTGQMGKAPDPFYDPLEFAIKEAHARGLLLHAWFNPYRALHTSATRPASPNHISQLRPDLAKPYGRYVWLDPGEREVQDYTLKVVLDVVRRYDIDGVHFDDYFYPYQEMDKDGKPVPFPDQHSWEKYLATGGKLSLDDWRRENVNTLIRRVSQGIKKVKPRVLFGVSPFGIWQPLPELGIKGFNAYESLYADSRKWLREGLIDYLSPQLYWPIKQSEQSYTTLLDWWISQNVSNRHLWPGNAAYRVSDKPNFPPSEIEDQILATRQRLKSPGNIFFSMKSFVKDLQGVDELLKKGVYEQAAVVPATPWVDSSRPATPKAFLRKIAATGDFELSWSSRGKRPAFWWVIHLKHGESWETIILPQKTNSYKLSGVDAANISRVAVSAVDRLGNESAPVIIKSGKPSR